MRGNDRSLPVSIPYTFTAWGELSGGEDGEVLRHEAVRMTKPAKVAPLTLETELVGLVTDAGGAGNPNIHLTNDWGSYLISATREQLAGIDTNILFRYVRLAVSYKYDIIANERRGYKLKNFLSAEPIDEETLQRAITEATKAWADVEKPSEWLAELRGT